MEAKWSSDQELMQEFFESMTLACINVVQRLDQTITALVTDAASTRGLQFSEEEAEPLSFSGALAKLDTLSGGSMREEAPVYRGKNPLATDSRVELMQNIIKLCEEAGAFDGEQSRECIDEFHDEISPSSCKLKSTDAIDTQRGETSIANFYVAFVRLLTSEYVEHGGEEWNDFLLYLRGQYITIEVGTEATKFFGLMSADGVSPSKEEAVSFDLIYKMTTSLTSILRGNAQMFHPSYFQFLPRLRQLLSHHIRPGLMKMTGVLFVRRPDDRMRFVVLPGMPANELLSWLTQPTHTTMEEAQATFKDIGDVAGSAWSKMREKVPSNLSRSPSRAPRHYVSSSRVVKGVDSMIRPVHRA